MSGVTKGKQNKGTKVTRMKGHGVPTAAKGGGGTSASVVNESDQSLLFNKDTENIKVLFHVEWLWFQSPLVTGSDRVKLGSLTKFPQNLSLLEQQTAATL